MKREQLIVGNYLHRYQKFAVFYLFSIALLGGIHFLIHQTTLSETLFGVLLLFISYLLFIAMVGKKGLYVLNNELYIGLSIAGKLLLKEKINSKQFDRFNYERKKKSNFPAILEYSGWGIYSNYHECIVYIFKSNSKKRKKLISLTDFHQYDEVRDFLLRWTRLREKTN